MQADGVTSLDLKHSCRSVHHQRRHLQLALAERILGGPRQQSRQLEVLLWWMIAMKTTSMIGMGASHKLKVSQSTARKRWISIHLRL